MRQKLLDFLISREETFNIHYIPTNNFTRNATRSNCAKLNSLYLNGKRRARKLVKTSLINENQLAIEVERKLKNILKARRQTRKRKLKRQQHEEKQQKTTTASGIDRTGSDDDDDDEPLDLTIK
ncbi:unnamed protein product [Rotaria sp. Silwood2]|nr:unnamed protein product [Rotaria sp. Silwood2]